MIDYDKPLWQLTVGEFVDLLRAELPKPEIKISEKKLAYGLKGIADLFGCSISTALRIKSSGKIDKAISQVGKKIVIDCDLVLKLYKLK